MSDKHELLEEVDGLIVHSKTGVDFNYFIYILLFLVFVAMLAFPKIYITEQIYFKSRKIAKLKAEADTLKAENRRIHASVESIKFKNQILDTLF